MSTEETAITKQVVYLGKRETNKGTLAHCVAMLEDFEKEPEDDGIWRQPYPIQLWTKFVKQAVIGGVYNLEYTNPELSVARVQSAKLVRYINNSDSQLVRDRLASEKAVHHVTIQQAQLNKQAENTQLEKVITDAKRIINAAKTPMEKIVVRRYILERMLSS